MWVGAEFESIINRNQRLMLGFISSSHYHPPSPSPPTSFPTPGINPQAPLPSPEGCGPIAGTLDGRKREGKEKQREGGHSWYVTNAGHDFHCGSYFSSSLFLLTWMYTIPTLHQPHDNLRSIPHDNANTTVGQPTPTWAALC